MIVTCPKCGQALMNDDNRTLTDTEAAELARIGNAKRLDVRTSFVNLPFLASPSAGGWAVAGL